MTLIVLAGSPSFAILVADRLISADGPLDPEFEKTAEIRCDDARFGMAFTGLAALPSAVAPRQLPNLPPVPLPAKLYDFSVGRWMVEAMGRVANEGLVLERVIRGFTAAATEKWAELPRLGIRKHESGIAFLMAGFYYTRPDKADTQPFSAVVSNYENDPCDVQDEFWCGVQWDQLYSVVGGMGWTVPEAALNELDRAVEDMAPPHMIVAKAVRAIREASRTPKGEGKIGGQCTSLVVPAYPRHSVVAEYHTEVARDELPRPPIVDVQRGRLAVVQTNLRMWVNPEDAPLVGPKIRRDERCWCGSGVRFKQCHGKS